MRGRDNNGGLEPVGDVLDGVMASIGGLMGAGDAAALWSQWETLAGEEWAAAKPLKLENGVLSLTVPDGITATRLRYDAGRLMTRIEARFGPNLVAAVRLKVDPRAGRS